MPVGLIWAQSADGVIGQDGGMPWHVPEDLAHFKALTLGHPVVMGRRTWESFPERFRPLPGRRNIVITHDDTWQADGAERAASTDAALALAGSDERVWIIGGGQIFRQALADAFRLGVDLLEITRLDLDVPGDTRAPEITGWRVAASDPGPDTWHTSRTGVRYRFVRCTRDATGGRPDTLRP